MSVVINSRVAGLKDGTIGGRSVSNDVPADNEVLTWNESLQVWEPEAGGGGGGGATTELDNLTTTAINADLIGDTGGNWNIQTADDNGGAQLLVLHGGDELGTLADGNGVLVRGGHSTGNFGGNATLNGGINTGTGNGGAALVTGGDSTIADGGFVSISGGFGPVNGGPVQISGGASSGTMGPVSMDGLYFQLGVGSAVGAVPLRFYENAGTNYVSIEAPATIASSFSLVWPDQLGAAGSVITDVAGDGVLSFQSPETYTPANGADWANPDPVTFSEAIDRLAAQLVVVGIIPIP